MEQMTNVLVIRVPRCIDDVDKCLEYIKRGLREGVLILGADVSYTVERFPKLGSIRVECGEDGNEQGEPAPELSAEAMAKEMELPKKQQAKKPALQARGIGAAEKKGNLWQIVCLSRCDWCRVGEASCRKYKATGVC